MKKIIISSLLAMMVGMAQAHDAMDAYVSSLMSRMTVEEKLGQLNLLPGNMVVTGSPLNTSLAELAAKGRLGGILNVNSKADIYDIQRAAVEKSRLGIPLLVGLDVVHGFRTIMPIPLAQACSWNAEAIARGAAVAANESTQVGINWTYSPMVDICVDPRWGRVAEGSGEDPYLGGVIAQAMVRGYQGNMDNRHLMACVKHFALYGASEAGRDYNTVDMSRLRMFNQYFPPYRAAVEAGAGSLMTSFNIVDGVPASANHWLLTDVLRHMWHFDGMVVTDYATIVEMDSHGIGDLKSSTARALKAGIDMDMCSKGFDTYGKALFDAGLISMGDIDRACRRVLEMKYKLGLFTDPYRGSLTRSDKEQYTAANRRVARDLAAQTFVLLKNQNNLLPLSKRSRIALIGPLGNNRRNMIGCWSTSDDSREYLSLFEAMQRYLGKKGSVTFAQGCNFYDNEAVQKVSVFVRPVDRVDAQKAEQEALNAAAQADVIVCAMGEAAEMSGESASRADLSLTSPQMRLLQKLTAMDKPVVLLNFTGRPTLMGWESEHVDAILNVWFPGSEGGDAICDVLFGDKSPSGRLVNTMPRNMGQIPLYYNHLNTSRPIDESKYPTSKYHSNYLDSPNSPLYPFGFGLTYTTFAYSDITLADSVATVTVTNTGKREGTEVVQLYIRDPYAWIARPVKELKGFSLITLKPGESRRVSFTITRKMLSYYDADGREVFEPGLFHIMIGPDSSDQRLKRTSIHID